MRSGSRTWNGCERSGAACDFVVEKEDMREVAERVVANLPFSQRDFNGSDRPIHVSYAPEPARMSYQRFHRQVGE